MNHYFKKSSRDRIAKSYGISNTENFKLEKNNLIVGVNGSGKTRLLNMVRDLCVEVGFLPVYMDFSQLGNKYQKSTSNARQNKDQFNWALMYKHIDLEDEESFKDLVAFTNNSIEGLVSFIKKGSNVSFSEKRFNEINSLLYAILGRKIVRSNNNFYFTDRNNDNSKTEFSKAIDTMSPGERSILYFVFQINIIDEISADYILLIDEPETHLHPIALTNLVKYINNNLSPKFSIIATHSVFLLPLYSFDEIKMMEDNMIKKPTSALYNDIYSKLIGFDDIEGNSIYKFLSSIYEWNYASFLAECFIEPGEISIGNVEDKQFKKLVTALSKFSNSEHVRVLDFGSGSGRIAKCLELLEENHPDLSIWNRLEYSMYDKYKIGDTIPQKKWMKEKIKNEYDLIHTAKKYDIIVLYNVLHEVSIDEWKKTIELLVNSLADNGYLLFGERRVLSKGENPYGKSGYFVLERNELEKLFLSKNIEEILLNEGMNDPTICYLINKKDMHAPSTEDIIDTIVRLRNRVKNEINKSIRLGIMDRKYAFYCQEYFNCDYAIDLLSAQVRDMGLIIAKI